MKQARFFGKLQRVDVTLERHDLVDAARRAGDIPNGWRGEISAIDENDSVTVRFDHIGELAEEP